MQTCNISFTTKYEHMYKRINCLSQQVRSTHQLLTININI